MEGVHIPERRPAVPARFLRNGRTVQEGLLMRRYHFDLAGTNSVSISDVQGAILDDDAHARQIARELASKVREGRPELIGQGYEILVRTAGGEEILRIAIDQPQGSNGS